jgi:bis(5'-nucleosyl)-tetraphosphatase (symmetrical)
MATYVVGDIQGCYDPLARLLEKVRFDPSQDRLWAVGDLVNRGPKSLKTLRFLKSLGERFTSVLGNHDLHFLALASGAHQEGKVTSLQRLLNAKDCAELCEWLRGFAMIHHEVLPTMLGERAFVMVHAGMAPSWTIEEALTLASEVETVLRGKHYKKFLNKMYGDLPDCWDPNLSGMKRLRVITNYLTRMRFCDEQGRLNLKIKTGAANPPKGFKPWYQHFNLDQDVDILFGHWATLQGVTNVASFHALDTGCVWGRCLTLMRLEDGRRFCTDCS